MTEPQKKPTAGPYDHLLEPFTLIVVPELGLDAQIVQRWIRANAPSALKEMRVLDTVFLTHLQGNQSVCAVFRSPETPNVTYYTDAAGRQLSTPRPDSETFPEIVVTKPVRVGDYWMRPSPLAPGAPDRPAFMEALQASLIPMRLDHVDKGAEVPNVYKLRTL